MNPVTVSGAGRGINNTTASNADQLPMGNSMSLMPGADGAQESGVVTRSPAISSVGIGLLISVQYRATGDHPRTVHDCPKTVHDRLRTVHDRPRTVDHRRRIVDHRHRTVHHPEPSTTAPESSTTPTKP